MLANDGVPCAASASIRFFATTTALSAAIRASVPVPGCGTTPIPASRRLSDPGVSTARLTGASSAERPCASVSNSDDVMAWPAA